MEPPISPLAFSAVLLVGMLIAMEVGRYLAVRLASTSVEDDERAGVAEIEGAVFALFGLLIAFTFSGAAIRFNEKRMLIAEEANAIGTAYLRIELLAPERRPAVKSLFRQYLDCRLDTYRKLPDLKLASVDIERSNKLQETIWSNAVAASNEGGAHPDAGKLFLPALNQMIDITTTRAMALQMHPPRVIHALLFCLALLCATLAGYRMARRRRSWLHIIAFILTTAIVVYVILDIEYPRAGLIRVVSADQVLVDLRNSME